MPTCIIIGTIVVNCVIPTSKPTTAEAAAILERAPGLSNRSHVYALSVEEQRRPQFVYVPVPTTPKRIERSTESDQARANRLGVPGGFTVLEWAIVHAGSKR